MSAAIAAISITTALASEGAAQSGGSAAAVPGGVEWPDQNWTDEQRRRYHHESQGTLTLPISSSWLLALEQPAGSSPGGLFVDPAYLETFGFIPSPKDRASNPDGLPIGFARTTGIDPNDQRPFDRIGFTCAACHTARMDFNGTSAALTNLTEFGTQLALALAQTVSPVRPDRFRRFADRILGPGNSLGQRLRLRAEVSGVVADQLLGALAGYRAGGVEEGFGRLDALNRIGNKVFGEGMGLDRNNVALTAPVAYPHIWDTHWFTWVQYNGSIEQPMVRNAGEAMGVGAVVNFRHGGTPRFTSTIPVDKLYDSIEAPLRGPEQPLAGRRFTGLTSPAWPEHVFGRIKPTLVAEGADLYRQRCQGCHLPAPNTPDFWTGNHWTSPNSAGERYLDLKMIDVGTVGTDPAQARDMLNRTVLVRRSLGLGGAIGTSGNLSRYRYGEALGQVVERTVDRWYDSQTPPVSAADRDRMNGHRPNGIRAPMKYKARPLNGIWATAPFLHNGSVPTLWHLLSPYAERPRSFRLGSRQFDPNKVGYVNAGPFKLVAVDNAGNPKPGNSNAGHLFDVPNSANRGVGIIGQPLSEDQRRALIEFLKTL